MKIRFRIFRICIHKLAELTTPSFGSVSFRCTALSSKTTIRLSPFSCPNERTASKTPDERHYGHRSGAHNKFTTGAFVRLPQRVVQMQRIPFAMY